MLRPVETAYEARFGHPFEHAAFSSCQNIQLLIHPIWWMTDESLPNKKIQRFLLIFPLLKKDVGPNISLVVKE